MFIVNELSTTIDLESTLIRAEALFRKFQRLVEAIDKKTNFPAPRFSLSTAAPSLLNANRPSTPTDQQKGKQTEQSAKSPGEPKKVITPELRRLLSKEVELLPRREAAKKKAEEALAKTTGK